MKLKDDEQVIRGYVLTKDQIKDARKIYQTLKNTSLQTEAFPGELDELKQIRSDFYALRSAILTLDSTRRGLKSCSYSTGKETFSSRLNSLKEKARFGWKHFVNTYALLFGDERPS